MVDVLLFGATGKIGAVVLEELIRRGVQTIVVTRSALTAAPGSRTAQVDPRDSSQIAQAAVGVDAIISTLGPGASADFRVVAEVATPLLQGAAAAGVPRVVVLGGAGSLIDRRGGRVIDQADFPDAWRASATGQVAALERYLADESDVDWLYVSPSHLAEPGAATGAIEVGGDSLLYGPDGMSSVTYGDLALALVNEALEPRVHRQRITVRSAGRDSRQS